MDRLRGLSRGKRLMVAVAVAIALFAIATGAQARTGGTLRLLGGHSGAAGRSCGVRPNWIYYHVRDVVRYSGHVPSRVRRVKVVVWFCYASGFKVLQTLHPRVSSTGAFKGSFAAHFPGNYFAKASYLGGHSNRAYFRVSGNGPGPG